MNAVCRSLFIVLFALGAHPAIAAPGAATLVAPSGDVVGTTIAFSWQSVPESTWYLFWLGKGTPTAFVMQQWYTAEQAGCANGGTCTSSLTPPINAGSYTWFIQTWAAGVVGPWSAGKQFVVKDPVQNWSSKLPDARRFTLVLDGDGVLDNETGLVWQRSVSPFALQWQYAADYCVSNVRVGSRFGWRLPTVSELRTLVDSVRTPSLPLGHPFTFNNGQGIFWTQTQTAITPNFYYLVHFFGNGSVLVSPNNESTLYSSWCIRAASAGGQ